MKKILVVIASKDFRDEEYLIPKKVFVDSGIEVVTASIEVGVCWGSLGAKVKAEKSIDQIREADYEAVVFVGGSGARIYFDNIRAQEIIVKMHALGRVVAAICIAPAILAKAGILEGKKATIHPGHKKYLNDNGVNYTGSDVEIDGNIITADGPKSAHKFAQAVTNTLRKE